jgi:hypothetical protein
MVDGKWVVKNRESLVYDQQELIESGKEHLKELLKRVKC